MHSKKHVTADGSGEDDTAIDWKKQGLSTGHSFLKQRVAIAHDGEIFKGTVMKWLPANPDVEDEPALFHILHDDGDAEDLEEGEAEAAIDRLKKHELLAKQLGKRGVNPRDVKRANNEDAEEDEGEEEVKITGHVGDNVLADFPHSREHCLNFKFSPGAEQQHCPNCFCFVCDTPCTRCGEWFSHCKAVHSSVYWQQQRQQRQLAARATDASNATAKVSRGGGRGAGTSLGPELWSYDRMMEAVQQVFPLESPEPSGLATAIKLRPYQKQSLAFMLEKEQSVTKDLAGRRNGHLVRGGWVCDEVGMGKTAVTIACVCWDQPHDSWLFPGCFS